MPHCTVSLARVLPLEVAASRRPNPGALTGQGARLLEDGEWVTTGEVWDNGCCRLTVRVKGKMRPLTSNTTYKSQGLNRTGQIPLFHIDCFQNNIPTSPCSWLWAHYHLPDPSCQRKGN